MIGEADSGEVPVFEEEGHALLDVLDLFVKRWGLSDDGKLEALGNVIAFAAANGELDGSFHAAFASDSEKRTSAARRGTGLGAAMQSSRVLPFCQKRITLKAWAR